MFLVLTVKTMMIKKKKEFGAPVTLLLSPPHLLFNLVLGETLTE